MKLPSPIKGYLYNFLLFSNSFVSDSLESTGTRKQKHDMVPAVYGHVLKSISLRLP